MKRFTTNKFQKSVSAEAGYTVYRTLIAMLIISLTALLFFQLTSEIFTKLKKQKKESFIKSKRERYFMKRTSGKFPASDSIAFTLDGIPE